MKPLDKIERLAEIADSINYHEMQLEARYQREKRKLANDIGTPFGGEYTRTVSTYNRLLRILELKYNRVLTEIK